MNAKKRIMVIDDSELIREGMKVLLSGVGYEVITFFRPFQTAHAILKEKPDLVILDLSMPGMVGDQIVVNVKKSSVLQHTRIVLFSDRPLAELKSRAQACGADAYIQKSADHAEILETVRRLCPLG